MRGKTRREWMGNNVWIPKGKETKKPNIIPPTFPVPSGTPPIDIGGREGTNRRRQQPPFFLTP